MTLVVSKAILGVAVNEDDIDVQYGHKTDRYQCIGLRVTNSRCLATH